MERYKLGHLLGKGAFGDVFLATDRKTNRKVAMKKLSKSVIPDLAEMERSMQEFSILVSLGHKNVIQLIEVVSDAQSIGIVMEFAGASCFYYAGLALGVLVPVIPPSLAPRPFDFITHHVAGTLLLISVRTPPHPTPPPRPLYPIHTTRWRHSGRATYWSA